MPLVHAAAVSVVHVRRSRPFTMSLLLFLLSTFVAACLAACAANAGAAADRPGDVVLEEGWTPEGYIDPGSGEAQRVQVELDPTGAPMAVWAGRFTQNLPFQIVSSRFDGTGWSEAALVFPASARQNQLPRMSRAPDGTLWLAWLQFGDGVSGTKTLFAELLAARYSGGAWSEPETVAVDLALPRRDQFASEFSILGVSVDEAWVVFARDPDGDPFSLLRDLYSSHRDAGGWSAPVIASDAGLSETRPELAPGPGGRPVVFFGFANATSVLWAKTWNGSAWEQGEDDVLTASAIFEHAVEADTSQAVRMVAFVREPVGVLDEDHIREYVWDADGFHPGPIILQAAVPEGGGDEPPDWQGLSLSSSGPCDFCPPGTPPLFRPAWIDFTPIAGAPRVFSTVREADDFTPLEVAGTTFEPAEAYPETVYDPALDRWYAVWTGAPTFTGLRRAKFAWTQSFAGDLGIGATFVAPDTVRISIVCSGDASGREIRVFRLAWDQLVPPPLAPPVPIAAVELPESPFAGPCPLTIDDRPAAGRYYYYAQLVGEGTFPADYARTSQAVVLDDNPPPPGGVPARTAFLAAYPQPAWGGTVTLPFDLHEDADDVTVTIHDVRGRVVRHAPLGARAAGRYHGASGFIWDVRDDAGRQVTGGVYFARLQVDGEEIPSAQRVVWGPGPAIVP